MISFKAFVDAIHDAIIEANNTLMDKNVSILDKFFEVPEKDKQVKKKIDDAVSKSEQVTKKGKKASEDDHKSAQQAMKEAQKALSAKGLSRSNEPLKAQSVVVQYPHMDSNGEIHTVDVHVPLITLVPIETHQIQEAKLTAEFEMEIIDDELQLNFGPRKGGGVFGKKSDSTYGTLEITISPQEASEGLKRLVEGYEKSLKSQIPH